MKLKPLAGHVVIEPIEEEMRTASGLVIPDMAKDRTMKGRVIATGMAVLHESGHLVDSPVDVDDIVYYRKWGGEEIKVEGKDYRIVKFSDLMCIYG